PRASAPAGCAAWRASPAGLRGRRSAAPTAPRPTAAPPSAVRADRPAPRGRRPFDPAAGPAPPARGYRPVAAPSAGPPPAPAPVTASGVVQAWLTSDPAAAGPPGAGPGFVRGPAGRRRPSLRGAGTRPTARSARAPVVPAIRRTGGADPPDSVGAR